MSKQNEMKIKKNITILTVIALLSFSCVNNQNRDNSNVGKKEEKVNNLVNDISPLNAGEYISQVILKKNVGTKSISSSEVNEIKYSKLFSTEGLLNFVANYDNRRNPLNQPTKFEDFLLIEVTYDNSESAKKAFKQIKSDAELSNSKEQIELDEELGDRIELLKLGERYGGLITFNGNQVFSLVENCDILPLNKSWLELEYMFTDVLKNKNGYVEVLKAGCDEGRCALSAVLPKGRRGAARRWHAAGGGVAEQQAGDHRARGHRARARVRRRQAAAKGGPERGAHPSVLQRLLLHG